MSHETCSVNHFNYKFLSTSEFQSGHLPFDRPK
jgi:hypothetical protein